MVRISPFERQLIAAALAAPAAEIPPGTVLALTPSTADFLHVFQTAIAPALYDCGFSTGVSESAFDSKSWLSDIARRLMGAELIIADLTGLNTDVLYVVGLCHGLGRCPLLITQDAEELPFNLDGFRRIHYAMDVDGLFELRENLGRAIRVFMAKAVASREGNLDRENRG